MVEIMEDRLSTRYDPSSLEDRWYKFWMKGGFFRADENSSKPMYSIVIPPPNITGKLHTGHGLNNTLQDVLIRWKRMQGYNTLWLPGTDHAGIATQNVVERRLHKEGTSRHDLGREKFVEHIWEWKEKYGNTIINQLQRLGCSCDWDRLRFTLDEGLSRAVRTVFKTLFDEGLIYRGNYIINWCPRCHTALSDDEVTHQDTTGKLWYIKYPIEGSEEFICVATTRPETMLGDTAVAANPGDERFKHLIGKTAILPLMDRPIPIIGDDFVDKEFGTGLVKVTPAHDPNDYQIGKRHDLEELNILEPDATINENGKQYKGLDRFTARKQIVADLESRGLIVKIEDHQHAVGHCYRCETIIEPYISEQWFVKMEPLIGPAIDVVKSGKLKFIPKNWENTYFSWMYNIRDWCISRQLWWGHRIPVWYCDDCDGVTVVQDGSPTECSKCGGKSIEQDPDVLDTWFSSALWPFSTLGWPEKTKDLEVYYPTSVLVTGHDIIFFWVARMTVMGLKFMGQLPFHDVYINALVRDKHGRKMSKSLGNAIDPLEVCDEYGTDSLRFTLCALAAQGRNVNLSPKRVEGYRNFMNKIWNASRFVLMNTEDLTREDIDAGIDAELLTLDDRWILSCFTRMVKDATGALEDYKFDDYANRLYRFFWNTYCDWYLEFVKSRLYSKDDNRETSAQDVRRRKNAQIILITLLEGTMRMLHPGIPFVTEELWQRIKERYDSGTSDRKGSSECPFLNSFVESIANESIMIAPWVAPLEKMIDEEAESKIALLHDLIYTIRNIRGEMGIPPATPTDVYLITANQAKQSLINENVHYFSDLIAIDTVSVSDAKPEVGFSSTGVVDDVEIIVPLPESLRNLELRRLEKELGNLEKEHKRLSKKLENENFISKAPEKVVMKEREKLQKTKNEMEKLQSQLKVLRED